MTCEARTFLDSAIPLPRTCLIIIFARCLCVYSHATTIDVKDNLQHEIYPFYVSFRLFRTRLSNRTATLCSLPRKWVEKRGEATTSHLPVLFLLDDRFKDDLRKSFSMAERERRREKSEISLSPYIFLCLFVLSGLPAFSVRL